MDHVVYGLPLGGIYTIIFQNGTWDDVIIFKDRLNKYAGRIMQEIINEVKEDYKNKETG